MRHDVEVQQAVGSYQLGLPRTPASGRSGELLGRGTGSSLEFQEFREYVPGDDVRHLDWAAYARSDNLIVRLYREEISPRTEILLDASRSMTAASPAKSHVARQLAAMFTLMSQRLGGRPSLMILRDDFPIRPLDAEGLEMLPSIPCDGTVTLAEMLNQHQLPLARRAVRIAISDFLFPHDPELLMRQLAGTASTLWLIQVLARWEIQPTVGGTRRLIDIESGAEAEMTFDRATVQAYIERLHNVQQQLSQCARQAHATFVTVVAEEGLSSICREELCRAEVLRPG